MSEPRQAVLRRKQMRGGLGRTLLTAFLLLAIGPLSVMSVYAVNRTRQERQAQAEQGMALLAASYAAQVRVAADGATSQLQDGTGAAGWRFGADGALRGATAEAAPPRWLDRARLGEWQVGGEPPALWVAAPWQGGWQGTLVALPPALAALEPPGDLAGNAVYVQQADRFTPLANGADPLAQGIAAALADSAAAGRATAWDNESETLAGRAPLQDGLALVVVRHPEAAATDTLATALIAVALLAALATTVGAALVTRGITRPLYELTRTTVQIARGDLTQRAQVAQDNELGILALAFNTMTTQLQETLATLEERVSQRTEELRQANAHIVARARQLELIAEVGAMVSAIHALEPLLDQGTRLMAAAFGYHDAAVWLLGRRAARAPGLTRRARASRTEAVPDAQDTEAAQLAARAFESGSAALSDDGHQLGLPLRVADNLLGSLVLRHRAPFAPDDAQHLQVLADTFAIAIENARASEMEGEALAKLRRLEAHRAEALGEMSHELSTALNSIIGFSHLMLKEVEGPLTDMQRTDLTFINRNGTHLLTLLDGMLELLDGGQPPERLIPTHTAETTRG